VQLNCGLALLIAGRAGNSSWGGASELFGVEGEPEAFVPEGLAFAIVDRGKRAAYMEYS